MSNSIKVVILGGGYGGVNAAKKIYRKYKKNKNIDIVIIDKNPYHTLMTELHEVAGSRVEPELVQVSFERIFGGKRVRVVTDEIKAIDFEEKTLKSDKYTYDYDYLVIGAGGEPEFFGIPGVQEHSFTLWSFEDAMRIRVHFEEKFREAAREPDPQERKEILTFAVAGAGFTGVELIGELLDRKRTLCRKYHIDENEVRILLVEALDNILPILPEKLQLKAEKYLKKKGAEILLNSPVTEVKEGMIIVGDGIKIPTRTFVWTCGIHGSEFTARIELTKGQCAKDGETIASPEGIHGMSGCYFDEDERYVVGERGRIAVDEHMKSIDVEDVYLVGDMIWYVTDEHVVPQIVETALQTSDTAAENIIADIEGGKKVKFKPKYHGFMVSIGGRYGVSNAGGITLTGIFAMAMKHLINLHYLLGLGGFNLIWDYLGHEFFNVKNRRSFLGGHLAEKVHVLWTLPLRLWIGGKWLYEGIKKITEGWLNPGDGGIFNASADKVYLPGVSFGDAGSSASPAAEGASQAADTAAQAADAASSASPAAEAAASSDPEPLIESLGIYDWFAENVLGISPSFAFIMQAIVVLAEVAIGLALIGGLFTFLAAGASILLGLLFLISGWGNPELLWYFFGAIVLMGGAGKAFGLDYWVMPWIKKRWNGTRLAKRTYLYDGEPTDK